MLRQLHSIAFFSNRYLFVNLVAQVIRSCRWQPLIILGAAWWAAALGIALPLHAQTLDEQYEHFLQTGEERCANLGFARDLDASLLPGQAGPNLYDYCTGTLSLPSGTPGTTVTTSSTGGASAAGISSQSTETALRDRRDTQAEDVVETTFAQWGRLGAFMTANYSRERHASNPYQAGQKAEGYGLLLGGDYRFDRAVAGLAFKHQHLTGDYASGGDRRLRNMGLVVYGAWELPQAVTLDLSAGLDYGNQYARRLVGRQTRYVTEVEREELAEDGSVIIVEHTEVRIVNEIAPHLTVGHQRQREQFVAIGVQKDVSLAHTDFGYRLAFTYQRHHAGAYVETGDTPMTLAFDAHSRTSLLGAPGVFGRRAFSFSGGVWVIQASLDWMREFRTQPQLYSARFAEDLRQNPARLSFQGSEPEREWLAVALSVIAVLPMGTSAHLTLERLAFHQQMTRTTASLGVRVEL